MTESEAQSTNRTANNRAERLVSGGAADRMS